MNYSLCMNTYMSYKLFVYCIYAQRITLKIISIARIKRLLRQASICTGVGPGGGSTHHTFKNNSKKITKKILP